MTPPRLRLALWLTLVLGLGAAAAADLARLSALPQAARRGAVALLRPRTRAPPERTSAFSREAHALKDNPAAIERAIRDELGFIHPGDRVLQLQPTP